MAANFGTHVFQRRDPEMERNDARMGVPRDPIGVSDRVISFGRLALFGIAGLVLVYAWFSRRYPPIRAKDLLLTTPTFFSGTLWFVGSFACNGMIEVEGVLRHCKFIAL
ncbi:hypothetical protein DL89DRAFT_292299 [Linderina pennispora]|uniref:Uncharacterized protein n=1 Tax=Linderina pennispora TaxID=61395 RepID=A0A1Y1WBZ1_9FUNG|nr:uncharacterized protein DL89DRAFT_292299 [Linderina pennispora]ORX70674.1 hypothetical protein DL89DRAFT_292299 [Linderina pennispora]